MLKLLRSLQEEEKAARHVAARRYREILEKGDNATDAEREELKTRMQQLGKTAADAGKDLRALADRAALTKLVAEYPVAEKESRAARKVLADHNAQADKIAKELAAKGAALLLAASAAEQRRINCGRAKNKLMNLEADHWNFLGLPEPPTTPNGPAGPGGVFGPPVPSEPTGAGYAPNRTDGPNRPTAA